MADDKNKKEKPIVKPKGPPQQRKEVRVSEAAKRKEGSDFSGVIRFIGRDLSGHLTVLSALKKIKGVGHNISAYIVRVIEKETSIKRDELVGNLTEGQVDAVEKIVSELSTKGLPSFLLNRQKDMDTGEDKHLISSDLTFQVRQDIEREKNSRSWVGWRHQTGQPVRGQHTRTTGRKGLTVGVLKKSLKQQKQQKAAAATTAKKK